MPRQSYSAVLDHSTDAAFRAWGKQLSDAIGACLTKTADTGQVDWTTVTKPASNVYVYEVYRFNDALQATAPVFLRVEYGTASSNPIVRITVGSATDGAGNLRGMTTAVMPSISTGNLSANPATTWVCYKDGAFTLAWGMNTGPTNQPAGLWVVERSRDSAGASTGDGLFCIYGGPTNPQGTTFSYPLNAVATQTGPSCLTNSLQSQQSSSSAVVNVFNWFCFTPDIHNLTAAASYKLGEIPACSEIDVAVVGNVSHHYVCLGGRFGGSWAALSTAYDGPMILWEV